MFFFFIGNFWKMYAEYNTNGALWSRILDSFSIPSSSCINLYYMDFVQKRKPTWSTFTPAGAFAYVYLKCVFRFSINRRVADLDRISQKKILTKLNFCIGLFIIGKERTKHAHFPCDGSISRDVGWSIWNRRRNAHKPTSPSSWNSTRSELLEHLQPSTMRWIVSYS